ncbi:AraC family transcriptional regulator [Roseivirga misakiensis]|uniref:HTH araC/xylS-type domain-containing protein n=1 Tax=Roseivirga misakiensis TaxID=1563681 RepID=A0A1E5T0S9_9BACT|nr:helix-turn-helix domain-containing protein [Roseivirga misakiensis]OEK04955.1 hypothetical protein BFP71_16115 [Roseivirga misakiensis]
MSLEDQMLFFFSAIGAFNGLFLSLYFGVFTKQKSRSSYFLAGLLFVLSVRVAKSVFMTFVPGISSDFIQVGLSACLLIGPFLYYYVLSALGKEKSNSKWIWHTLPIVVAMIVVGYYFPYREHRYLWQRKIDGYLAWFLFTQWLAYIIISARVARDAFKRVFSKANSDNIDFWLVNLIICMAIIWLAYFTNGYTSYIVGALSFSFTLYLSILIWVFKKRDKVLFFEAPKKYANKKIDAAQSKDLMPSIVSEFKEQKAHHNPSLKLSDLANKLAVPPHYLSQYLNDNLNKNFSTLVNEYRIEDATQMIGEYTHLTLEAIGYECGFKSNSAFYNAFKKFKGITPAQYKKSIS